MTTLSVNGLVAATQVFTKPGLAAGTTTTYTVANAFDYTIKGKFGTQFGTKTNQATPTTDAVTGAAFPVIGDDKGAVLVWATNSSGAVQLMQGEIEDLDAASGEFIVAANFPNVPDTLCPFGYTVIQNQSGSDFTVGSTNWGTAGITDTFVDIGTLPSRPQES